MEVDLYEKIKMLAATKKISIRRLEEQLEFGNGTINRWRKNKPGIDKLQKVADFFGVTTDYLLGRADDSSTSLSISETDLNAMLDNAKSFDGMKMDEDDREAIKAFIQGRLSK